VGAIKNNKQKAAFKKPFFGAQADNKPNSVLPT